MIRETLNKIKNLPLFWKTLLSITAFVSLCYAAAVIWIPSYRFDDPEPFSGKFIFNPYSALENPKEVIISEDSLPKTEKSIFFVKNIHLKQHEIDKMLKESAFSVIAKPHKNYKIRDLQALDKYRLIEVFAQDENATDYWDMALSSGRRARALATQNVHTDSDTVKSNIVFSSLENGDAYILIRPATTEDTPSLTRADINGDTVTVAASLRASEIRFIGQNGSIRHTEKATDKASYIFQPNDTYIRTEILFDNGCAIYLNAFVRHPFNVYYDQQHAVIIKGRTWLMRIAFVIAIICIIKMLFDKKNED
ncbi:MAG: hypothetical protein MJZ56_05725 [Bacteroidales bacterium]|nr:hypothetical protein [Bacteroidales bacterium]